MIENELAESPDGSMVHQLVNLIANSGCALINLINQPFSVEINHQKVAQHLRCSAMIEKRLGRLRLSQEIVLGQQVLLNITFGHLMDLLQ